MVDAENEFDGVPASEAWIEADIERITRDVPFVGDASRWYDYIYRFGVWLDSGSRRRLWTAGGRRRIDWVINSCSAYNQLQRERRRSRHDATRNLVVPPDERVQQLGVWVIEFFPPSRYERLIKDLKSNGWDYEAETWSWGPATEGVKRGREAGGGSIRLGMVSHPGSHHAGSRRMKIPAEFDLIELSASQVGSSLTAVTATILLSDEGRGCLNAELHRQFEPRMWWKGFRRPPEVTGRLFTSFRTVRAERTRLHGLARTWLATQCSGVFASGERNTHPVIDMVVFDRLDLTLGEEPPAMREPLRAMALEGSPFDTYHSPQLAGAVIVPPRRSGRSNDEPTAWSVVGRVDALMAQERKSRTRDEQPSLGSLVFGFDPPIQALLRHVAVLDFLLQLQDRYVNSRDSAHRLHQRFAVSRVERFRSELLSFGLDLTAVVRDTATLWRESERQWDGIEVKTRAKMKDANRSERDIVASMGQARKRIARDLVTDFAAYRDVVTTTAALGSTASATRNGRLALLVAVASLLVACGALVGRNGLDALIERAASVF